VQRPAAALLVLAAVALGGCASFQAARLYRSGTQALDRGDPARAVAELEQAATLAPRASSIQNHLGIAYEASGRPDDALRAYQRAVDLDCGNGAAQYNLATLRARLAAAVPR
jgi:Flp pilus assembly protein TadD